MKINHTGSRLALVAVLAAAAAAACEDGGTGPRIAASMQVVSGDLQRAPVASELPAALVVRVVDGRGRAVAGQIVNFRVVTGGGSVFAGSAETNREGEARERWTLGIVAADTQRVEVRAVDPSTGEARTFAVFRAVGTPAAPAEVTQVESYSRGALPNTAVVEPLAVVVKDAYGNLVPGGTVSWSVQAGSGSISPAQSAADAGGIARATWTLSAAPTQFAHAVAGSSAPAVFRGTTEFQIWRLGTQQTGTAGVPLADPVVVQVTEPAGGYVGAMPIEWTVVSGGGTVSPSRSITGPGGAATTQWTLGSASTEQRLRATVAPGVFVEHVAHLQP
jgi:hypothetical protein